MVSRGQSGGAGAGTEPRGTERPSLFERASLFVQRRLTPSSAKRGRAEAWCSAPSPLDALSTQRPCDGPTAARATLGDPTADENLLI
ncbi:MAG TPA: hypothetical protein DFS52_06610, partial [Myxococcales bacterium]|nr:hypothetical protein [Myxococcales bacterium]